MTAAPRRVRLVAPESSAHTKLWVEAFRQRGHSVEVVSVRPPTTLGLLRQLLRAPAGRIGRPRPDVVVIHSLGTHALVGLLLPKGRRNIVVPWGSEVAAARQSLLRGWVARRVLARAHLILVTSTSMARTIERHWPVTTKKTEIVSWGVSSSFLRQDDETTSSTHAAVRRRLGVDADQLLVVAPRGIGPVYRSDELREAFAAAQAVRGDLRLVVLGADGSMSTPCKAELLSAYVPKPQLAELLAAADAVVSVPASDQRSTTVLEAAASGARLLLSDIPAYRELVHLGVEATLLADPLLPALTAAFVSLERLPSSAAGKNRELMRDHEDQERQMAQVVSLCTSEARCASD